MDPSSRVVGKGKRKWMNIDVGVGVSLPLPSSSISIIDPFVPSGDASRATNTTNNHIVAR